MRWAAREAASDLHLRPADGELEVLLRRDGVLQRCFSLPAEISERLFAGLKNMAGLPSYRKSVPQDGRMLVDETEVRVALTPTHFGEKAVLRLVRGGGPKPELEELGFTPDELRRLHKMASQPQGLVLATGPAGSGKTTTLLALMRWLYGRHQELLKVGDNQVCLNVVTLEDPVETVIPEFSQTAIQAAAGMTFASGLRSLLRQDPEVVLVGEIRDAETAAAVVSASLSGHLVFSSLHARDSVGVVPRLLEMGVQPYQLAAGLCGVVYQRLLRKLCPHCRQDSAPVGCESCKQSGYAGRTAVPELLVCSEDFRQGILEKWPLERLREAAGVSGLRAAAMERVQAGVTSLAEVQRGIPA